MILDSGVLFGHPVSCHDVVLEAWSRGASMTKNSLGLGLGLKTQGLGLDLDKKVFTTF